MTVRATALTQKPFAATPTFVDRVCNQQTLALELSAKDCQINGGLRLVTQPIGALLAGLPDGARVALIPEGPYTFARAEEPVVAAS